MRSQAHRLRRVTPFRFGIDQPGRSPNFVENRARDPRPPADGEEICGRKGARVQGAGFCHGADSGSRHMSPGAVYGTRPQS